MVKEFEKPVSPEEAKDLFNQLKNALGGEEPVTEENLPRIKKYEEPQFEHKTSTPSVDPQRKITPAKEESRGWLNDWEIEHDK